MGMQKSNDVHLRETSSSSHSNKLSDRQPPQTTSKNSLAPGRKKSFSSSRQTLAELNSSRFLKTHKVGDKVFGHVRGYPPWPASITSELSNNRFVLYFYGTRETGVVNSKDMIKYTAESKSKMVAKY